MGDSIQLIFLGFIGLILLYFLVSVVRANKVGKTSLNFQDEARQSAEKLLASVAETKSIAFRAKGEATGCESLAGISSGVLPRSNRPAFACCTPPHCLKKNGTRAA